MERTSSGRLQRCVLGLVFILVYALPLFWPPLTPAIPVSAALNPVARLFPQVPAWWTLGRLVALALGVTLIASATPTPVLGARLLHAPAARPWTRPWVRYAALLAAAMHAAGLLRLSVLPPVAQTLYMLWFLVPAGLLAWGSAPAALDTRSRDMRLRSTAWPVGVIIVVWFALRLAASWHAPRAADIVDSWRTFGGLVQLASSQRNFLTASMDPELPGVNATPLFFQGLPLLQMTAHAPSLTWVQVANASWLALTGAMVARLAAVLVGPSVSPVATAVFLFSPFSLFAQLTPTVAFIGPLSVAALGFLLVEFWRSGSPAILVLLGGVAGITSTYPAFVPATGLTLLLAAWRCRTRPRTAPLVVLTALMTYLAMLGQGVPSPDAVRKMLQQYATSHFPMAIAELALHGQLSPTTANWLDAAAPQRWAIPAAVLLFPFVTVRQPLFLWGDTSFEPLSAGLFAVGLITCARRRGGWVTPFLLAFTAATLAPGCISSYDRLAPLRVAGAPVPLAVLAAVGFASIQRTLSSAAARRWATPIVVVSIAVSGIVLFDVVNPRILPASALGLLVRSVEPADLSRVALLTAHGRPQEENVDLRQRHWELDWLRVHHPYIDEIVRCVPKHPIAIVPVDRSDILAGYDVLSWSPALEETANVSEHICTTWPNAELYTITDAAGLSRVYAVQPRGPGWRPALPQARWTTVRCGDRRPSHAQ